MRALQFVRPEVAAGRCKMLLQAIPAWDRRRSRQVSSPHPSVRTRSYFLVFALWRGPPTGGALLCMIRQLASYGDAPCRSRTTGESVRWSACAWLQSVCNWRATLIAPRCNRIFFGWRRHGTPWRIGASAQISDQDWNKQIRLARARTPRQPGAPVLFTGNELGPREWFLEGWSLRSFETRHARLTSQGRTF